MSGINNAEAVKAQYATAGNLNTRISIHSKYSTNKMGFGNWIASNYDIKPGVRLLELGCGTGDLWKSRTDLIDKASAVFLTDLSEGMLDTAKASVGDRDNVTYKIVDIQNIPFDDNSFDVVIANMMLYHVPDMGKGLSEVRRVLKNGGIFYCATYGEHGIVEYIAELLKDYGVTDNVDKKFTLQNGIEILGNYFSSVERLDYEDSLEVTDVDDLIGYIYSMSGMSNIDAVGADIIKDVFLSHMVNGILTVPKEYGMFVSRK